MRLPFSNLQLMKIASCGAVFIIGNALLMRYLTQKRLKQSPYFILARENVLANEALVKMFGEPLDFRGVDLDNSSKNFSTSSEARFEIPMTGSKTQGMLYLSAIRRAESELPQGQSSAGWKLKSLEVTVADKPNQKLILVKDENDKSSLS